MKKCFVISPIGEEGSDKRKHADEVFECIIEPALDNFDIKAYRADHVEKTGRISEQMFESIFSSDLCIAVLTDHNPNVFYELALAQSAIIPVILMIEKGQSLPFDVSDLRTINYDLGAHSYKEKTHINRLVKYIEELESSDWYVSDYFANYKKDSKSDIEFFESTSKYGKHYEWSELLEKTVHSFDIMGVALSAWRRTTDFEKTIATKTKEVCKVRVLLMHEDNPYLNAVTVDKNLQLKTIAENYAYYKRLSDTYSKVEVKQIKIGIPHFFLSRSDSYVVLIQFLNSHKWGKGPVWRCTKNCGLYEAALSEFDELWGRSA